MSSKGSPQGVPPDENQIKDWQSQWDETKAMYQAEIDFMNQTITSKTQEYNELQANPLAWSNMSLQERSTIRQQIILAQQELAMIQGNLAIAKAYFIADNPTAEHYVQF